jgi:hypothetical protein
MVAVPPRRARYVSFPGLLWALRSESICFVAPFLNAVFCDVSVACSCHGPRATIGRRGVYCGVCECVSAVLIAPHCSNALTVSSPFLSVS